MVTPHIAAGPADFAPRVLMPGDPLRARRIAQDFLTDARQVTDVRGILGFTGTYRGEPMSVMASGMGAPSMSIYATELFRFYGVQRIIRVGTAGALQESLSLGDVIVVSAAHTDATAATVRVPGVTLSLAPSPRLLVDALAAAGDDAQVGPVLSSDYFYLDRPEVIDRLTALGTLAVEMEAAGLYAVAAAEQREALTVLTVSDHIRTGEAMDAATRETRYQRMVDIAARALLARPVG
ncbi:purine-nucleoside phosphorylase [Streptacidiphilus jiangxiensis]|uniref:Uridine phosphorylase n=1 Tax=Streptacidiphilus jiangxiensis TaxID=235985 RepID=A0A1H7T0K2_STRJI|nr:purine-nucleoside phosphorylase [Streptacidiphilus jiangxiensis]SEL78391.1 purine-nucleoside phosphorylase [Streptacidiphilus jiangxiensis]